MDAMDVTTASVLFRKIMTNFNSALLISSCVFLDVSKNVNTQKSKLFKKIEIKVSQWVSEAVVFISTRLIGFLPFSLIRHFQLCLAVKISESFLFNSKLFFSCLPDCNREYYENLKYCPCREFCPNGCPCEGFNCDLIDISTSTEWSSSTHKTVTTETTTTLVTSGLLRVFNFIFSIFEPQ